MPEEKEPVIIRTTPPLTGLRLARVRARNLRKVNEIDVTVPENIQCVCLVGPNGGGKSSVLSHIVQALRQSTSEEVADLKQDGRAPNRNWTTTEVGGDGRLFGFRVDWTRAAESAFQAAILSKSSPLWPEGGVEDAQSLEVFLGLSHQQSRHGSDVDWMWFGGSVRARGEADFVSRSVFLDRPADRFELPHYEETPDLVATASIQERWVGKRLMPIRVSRGLPLVEKFILDMALDASLAAESNATTAATRAFETIGRVLQELTGSNSVLVPPWPYRRVGAGTLSALSLLSAGELDVLVTVVLIVAQQVYLRRKWRMPHDAPDPGGVVFIDELDAHLHPAWQQRVLPLYSSLFPTVQFVVTTHSPFVLRSVAKSLVIRLPDGRIFDQDFASWSADDILSAVFEISPQWSAKVEGELEELRRLVGDESMIQKTVELYLELAGRSEPLRAACDAILAIGASMALRDAIRAHSKPSHA